MSRKLIKLALVAGVTLVAACDESDNNRGSDEVTRGLQDLGGPKLVAAFQADANSEPVNAQTISIEPQPRAEPFDPN